MALLSPSDLVWIIGFTPQGRWIAPIMRAAVRAEWPSSKRLAEVQLGDVGRAHELMEIAIGEVKDQLAESTPLEADRVRELLRRSYNNALRRERRALSRLSYSGTGADLEILLPSVGPSTDPINAQHDLATILRDTPPDVRRALLMRYGARSRWEEVAEEMQKSKDAVRHRCQRELNRIRKRLGIRGSHE
jgi:hypothetical protein